MAITTPLTEDATTSQMGVALTTPAQAAVSQANAAQTTSSLAGPASLSTGVTSEERLAGILNKGGALMQQAATAGGQQAASRGLLNSSMGVQAAQGAMIDRALPIAQTDASLLTNTAEFNAGALNQNAQFNANNQQQVNLANQQTQQQTKLANQQALNQGSQFNASNQQQTNLANQQAQQAAGQFNAQQQNAQNQFNAQQQNEAIFKALDVNSREQLANIEADYKQIMQVNASAGTMYEQVMKNINDIQTNKDIADKQTAINSQLAWLRSGMQMVENLNGVSGLVTF